MPKNPTSSSKILIVDTEHTKLEGKIERCRQEFPVAEIKTTNTGATAVEDLYRENHGFTHIMVWEEIEKLQCVIWEDTRERFFAHPLSPKLLKLQLIRSALGL